MRSVEDGQFLDEDVKLAAENGVKKLAENRKLLQEQKLGSGKKTKIDFGFLLRLSVSLQTFFFRRNVGPKFLGKITLCTAFLIVSPAHFYFKTHT